MKKFSKIRNLFGITDNNGYSEEELIPFTQGNPIISSVLKSYYIQLGKVNELNHTQDNLITPERFKNFQNKDYYIFYSENQCVGVWGIRKKDLNIDNPKVFFSYDEKKWELECEKLTDFLNAMANLQAVFSLPYSKEEFSFINKSELEIIKQNFRKKEYSFSKWIGIDFYGNNDNDVIVVMKDNGIYNLLYSSRIEEHYEKMNDILKGLGK